MTQATNLDRLLTALGRRLIALMALVGLTLSLAACGGMSVNTKAEAPLSPDLLHKIAAIGSTPGAPMMLRIFKQDSVMEVWKQTQSGQYALLTTYQICAWSGGYGPKLVEGDYQAPEGFYDITPALMNPDSHYYLAFNTGFPNKFDKAWGRTGANLMVHGDCSSAGCYAMTDEEIADIFALARESFAGGNRSVQLEIFPFRMTPANLAAQAGNPNMAFWKNIKTGYDSFEMTHTPPRWDVCDKKYVFDAIAADGTPLDAPAACPSLKTDTGLMAQLDAKAAADDSTLAADIAARKPGPAAAPKTGIDPIATGAI